MQKTRGKDYCERNKYIKLRNSFPVSNCKIIHSDAAAGGVL